jgi:hypothetical protein
MKRWREGLEGGAFFQKQAPKGMPDWIPTRQFRTYPREGDRDSSTSHLVNSEDALLWMQSDALHRHELVLAEVDKPDRPDFVLFDLARLTRRRVPRWRCGWRLIPARSRSQGSPLYVKTSGADRIRAPPDHPRSGDDETYESPARLATARSRAPWRDDRVAEEEAVGCSSTIARTGTGRRSRLGVLGTAEARCAGLDAAPLGRVDRGHPPATSRWQSLDRVQRVGDLFEPVLRGGQSLGPPLREVRRQAA